MLSTCTSRVRGHGRGGLYHKKLCALLPVCLISRERLRRPSRGAEGVSHHSCIMTGELTASRRRSSAQQRAWAARRTDLASSGLTPEPSTRPRGTLDHVSPQRRPNGFAAGCLPTHGGHGAARAWRASEHEPGERQWAQRSDRPSMNAQGGTTSGSNESTAEGRTLRSGHRSVAVITL